MEIVMAVATPLISINPMLITTITKEVLAQPSIDNKISIATTENITSQKQVTINGTETKSYFTLVGYDKSLQSQGGMGLLWYTKKKYKDFVLKLDWKVSRINDNSGVFVRFSDPDNDPLIAVNTGYEIQIDDLAMPDGNPLQL